MVYLERQPALHCLLTSAQSPALDEVACAARIFVQRQELEVSEKFIEGQMQSQQRTLDSGMPSFLHRTARPLLNGSHLRQRYCGLLGRFGDRFSKRGLSRGYYLTSHLSALIKIAQMRILRRAVAAAEDGKTEYPAQMIEVMQDRFMVYGSPSPINWAQKL
jgi:hypothetical protein